MKRPPDKKLLLAALVLLVAASALASKPEASARKGSVLLMFNQPAAQIGS